MCCRTSSVQRGCLCSPLLAVDPHSLSKQTVERLVNKIRIFFSLREGGGEKKVCSRGEEKDFLFPPFASVFVLLCCRDWQQAERREWAGSTAGVGSNSGNWQLC